MGVGLTASTYDQYVAAACEAGQRTRACFVILVMASVLVFAAAWNSRADSWLNKRAQLASRVEEWIPFDPEKRNALTPQEQELFDEAKSFASLRGIRTEKDIENLTQALARLRAERMWSIAVPFFGISVDINDLGLLGGLALVLVMLLNCYALRRHLESLRTLVDRIATNDDYTERSVVNRVSFDLLRMRNVFISAGPSEHSVRPVFDSLVRWSPVVLLLLPLVAQGFVLYNDYNTWEYGRTLNARGAVVCIVATSFWLAILTFLAAFSLTALRAIDAEWRNWESSLGHELLPARAAQQRAGAPAINMPNRENAQQETVSEGRKPNNKESP